MVIGAIILMKRRHLFSIDVRTDLWLFFLYAYMLVSAAWSVDPGASAKRWLRTVGDLIMVLVVLSEEDEREAFEHLLTRCAIVLLPLSIILIKYYRPIGVSYNPFGEMMNVGVTTQKNALGILCAVSGVLFLWRLMRGLPRVNFLNAFYLGLSVYLLHLSQSATSTVVFIAGSLVLCFNMVFKLNRKSHNRVVIALLLFMILVQVFMTNALGDSLIPDLFSATGRDNTLTGRVPLWRDLIVIGSQRPVFGAGYGGFWFSHLSSGLWAKHPWRPVSGHNGYIDLYLELGVVGLVLFFLLLVGTFRKVLHRLEANDATDKLDFALLFMIVLHNITESSYAKAVSFLWILFLFVVVVVGKRERSQNGVSQEPCAVTAG